MCVPYDTPSPFGFGARGNTRDTFTMLLHPTGGTMPHTRRLARGITPFEDVTNQIFKFDSSFSKNLDVRDGESNPRPKGNDFSFWNTPIQPLSHGGSPRVGRRTCHICVGEEKDFASLRW